MEPEAQTRTTSAGGSAVFPLSLHNNGTLAGTYNLTATGTPTGWTTSFMPASVAVAPSATGHSNLTVVTHPAAQPGSALTLTVSATETGFPGVADSVEVTVTVEAAGSPSPTTTASATTSSPTPTPSGTPTPTVPATPDLVVADLAPDPAQFHTGDSVRFVALVTNRGGATAPPSFLGVRLDGEGWLGNLSVGDLPAGKTVALRTQSWTATPGDHEATATADLRGDVHEADETNNERTARFRVAAAPEHEIPVRAQATQEHPPAGGRTSVEVAVTNPGPAGGSFVVQFFASDNRVGLSLRQTVVQIGPGQTSNLTVEVDLPPEALPNQTFLLTVLTTNADNPRQSGQADVSLSAAAPPTSVADPGGADPIGPAGLAAATGAAVLVGAWAFEPLRYRLLSLLGSLFARIHRGDLLDHDLRARIHETIGRHPGVNYATLRRQLTVPNGTLTHHLRVLERAELIRVRRQFLRVQFFPTGRPLPPAAGAAGVQERVLALVRADPGLRTTEVSKRLGLSKQLASYHLLELARRGEVRIDRAGRTARCYASAPPPSGPRMG